MKAITRDQIENWAQATVVQPKKNTTPIQSWMGIGTDTRKDLSQQLFWALKGESFDGHDFLEAAVKAGATGVVVNRDLSEAEVEKLGVAVVKVDDTLRALQRLAQSVRRQFKGKVIGITGSNGKTSTKEFTATILKTAYKVHWNPGSFNNHFGLPFNILAAPLDADALIAEMGMNHAGELTELCEIAEPDIVLCTMVGSAHIEHFGSAEKIAAAKEEIYLAAPKGAMRIFNLDNPWTEKMFVSATEQKLKGRITGPIMCFSNQESKKDNEGVSVVLFSAGTSSQGLRVKGRIGDVEKDVQTSLWGDHNLVNLAAAAAASLAVGMSAELIWRGLSLCKPHWGRMHSVKSKSGSAILFDGYNANPESMRAMLESLRQLPQEGQRYAVLAEMKELGEAAYDAHFKLGEEVGRAGFQGVWFFGPSFAAFEAGIKSAKFDKNLIISDTYKEELASKMASMLNPKDLVVVKGSRGMKTERFVLALDPVDFTAK
ncbi:MAG: hypothetical protein ABS42_00145 [Bdellovibrio sp. SCN 50-8]|nr:MAG: hypothetical protein ABS42_00145 [Bdellovibrio sp. SCN 50-8]